MLIERSFMMKRCFKYSALAAVMVFTLAGSVRADAEETKAEEYLSEYYNIEPFRQRMMTWPL